MQQLSKEAILDYNRKAWDSLSRSGNRWTVPVTQAVVDAARKGNWEVLLTPSVPVPRSWFPAPGAKVLCLASGGGQQSPIFAAYGYKVTSFDLSQAQLDADGKVAKENGLEIERISGDMADLSVFPDACFDMVFNPCSTTFVPDVLPVYREAARVLRNGGIFMTGFTNPVYYLFDLLLLEKGEFRLKYTMPYSDARSLDETEKKFLSDKGEPLVFGHSLQDLINGQLQAGLSLTDLFEDSWGGNDPVDKYFKPFISTRAVKLPK